MNDPQDAQIDLLIRRHVRSELDRHVGKASKRFAAHVAAEEQTRAARMKIVPAPAPADRRRSEEEAGPRFGSFWTIGLVGAALAATLTIVSMRNTTVRPATNNRNDNGAVVRTGLPGDASIDLRTQDLGIVRLPDGSVARKYLNKRTDTVTWKDPKTGKRIEYQQPRQETLLVGLKQH